MPEHTDLSNLERFCRGDQELVQKYVGMYLESATELFDVLVALVKVGEGERLAVAAHSLRPQVNYMGAQRLSDLLTAIETKSRTEGTAACSGLVEEAVALNGKVMAELREQAGQRT